MTDTELRAGVTPQAAADAPQDERGAPARVRGRGTPVQRLRAGLLTIVSAISCRLPEGPQVALAEMAGRLWYRIAPARAGQARRNLRRIVTHLVETGMADARVQAAAEDPRALERLVRSAFRHNARYYLEVVRAPALTSEWFEERLTVETPEVVADAFADDRAKVFISGHLGPIEMPGLYLAKRSGRRIVAPMETVGDPALQDWFERTRAAFGVRIVTLREARRELTAALARGESVGLVADRDIKGGGIEVPLFGAPAPLPIGPALLATESGSRLFLAGVWRVGRRGYRGRLAEIPVVREGPRRGRIAGTLAAEAAGFERMIANAPDQWSAVFFPIWPDLEAAEAAGDAGNVSAPAPAVDGEASR
jgi:KDO2-lipid IV(A) lauroyltransferase